MTSPALNEPWFHRQLDKLCTIWEITPVGMVETPRGAVYIAEGWHAKRPDHAEPGWTVLWAVKHRGMCVALPIYMKTRADAETRRRCALQKALEFLGTYHGQPPSSLQKAS